MELRAGDEWRARLGIALGGLSLVAGCSVLLHVPYDDPSASGSGAAGTDAQAGDAVLPGSTDGGDAGKDAELVGGGGTYLWLIGGAGDGSNLPVWGAELLPSGDVGPWFQAADSVLGGELSYAQAVYHEGMIYLFGGFTAGQVASKGVSLGTITPDGHITWRLADFTLPAENAQFALAFRGGRVYVIGGTGSLATGDIWSGAISGGTLHGGWRRESGKIQALAPGAAFSGDTLLVVGGDLPSGTTSLFRLTTAGTDGVLGAWGTATGDPARRAYHGFVEFKGLYVALGGAQGWNGKCAYNPGALASPINFIAEVSASTLSIRYAGQDLSYNQVGGAPVVVGDALFFLGGCDLSDAKTSFKTPYAKGVLTAAKTIVWTYADLAGPSGPIDRAGASAVSGVSPTAPPH